MDKKFIKWMKKEIKKGYKPVLTADETDKLIQKIANTYVGRYHNSNLEDEDIIALDETIFKDLLDTLDKEEKFVLDPHYESEGDFKVYDTETGEVIEHTLGEPIFQVDKKGDPIATVLIYYDETGKLLAGDSFEYGKTINDLYELFKDDKQIDCSKIEKVIRDYNNDIKVRDFVIDSAMDRIYDGTIRSQRLGARLQSGATIYYDNKRKTQANEKTKVNK